MSESERKTTSEKRPVVEQKPAVGPKSENFKEAVLRWIHAVNIPMALFVGVVTLAILYFGAIESRVKELVRDPDFVERVAQRARPAIVFDADRHLLADAGAYKFLEGIPEVKLNVKDDTVKSGLQIPYTFTRISFAEKLPLDSATNRRSVRFRRRFRESPANYGDCLGNPHRRTCHYNYSRWWP